MKAKLLIKSNQKNHRKSRIKQFLRQLDLWYRGMAFTKRSLFFYSYVPNKARQCYFWLKNMRATIFAWLFNVRKRFATWLLRGVELDCEISLDQRSSNYFSSQKNFDFDGVDEDTQKVLSVILADRISLQTKR